MRNLPRLLSHSTLLALAVALTGCTAEPVEWGDVSYRQSQPGDPDTRSSILSTDLPPIAGSVGACIQSIRTAGSGGDLFRVWWSARSDSDVVLAIQHSGDQGRSWLAPRVVETRDRGRRGCARPAPDVSFDPGSGYLYLVYFIEAGDGAGVFFAHSMDRGELFHAPVPVVYGNGASAASVVGKGDSVVVVFEDPNSTHPRIGFVLSHTAGHIFEERGEVTPDEAAATAPWVALDHRKITVWWKERDQSPAGITGRVGYRVGVWK